MTPSGAMFYVTDYLGSVRAVVDGKTGDLYKASDYSAFGDEYPGYPIVEYSLRIINISDKRTENISNVYSVDSEIVSDVLSVNFHFNEGGEFERRHITNVVQRL